MTISNPTLPSDTFTSGATAAAGTDAALLATLTGAATSGPQTTANGSTGTSPTGFDQFLTVESGPAKSDASAEAVEQAGVMATCFFWPAPPPVGVMPQPVPVLPGGPAATACAPGADGSFAAATIIQPDDRAAGIVSPEMVRLGALPTGRETAGGIPRATPPQPGELTATVPAPGEAAPVGTAGLTTPPAMLAQPDFAQAKASTAVANGLTEMNPGLAKPNLTSNANGSAAQTGMELPPGTGVETAGAIRPTVATAAVAQASVDPATLAENPALTGTAAPMDPPLPARVATRREKTAYALNRPLADIASQAGFGEKTFVSRTPQGVRGDGANVGTGIAQSPSDMPSAHVANRTSVENQEFSPVLPVSAGGGQAAAQLPTHFAVATAPEPAVLARDTVAAVLHAVEAQEQQPAHGASRVVNLRFDFGPDTLAVRVELREGAVQAHFHTDSPELRAALAQEWRHAAGVPENTLRLAEPVFAPATSRGEQSPSFNTDGGASRQQSQAQQPTAEFFARPSPSGLAPASAHVAPEVSLLPTVLHLQAFA